MVTLRSAKIAYSLMATHKIHDFLVKHIYFVFTFVAYVQGKTPSKRNTVSDVHQCFGGCVCAISF
jgi:hypothetical protein